MNQFLQALQTASELIAQAKKQGVEALKPALEAVVKENPGFSGIRWTQYAPHFNDGEACVFHVHELEAQIAGERDEDDEDEGGWFDVEYVGKGYRGPDITQLQTLAEILRNNEDILQEAFGDGVQVVVTKDGIEVNEYDHD